MPLEQLYAKSPMEQFEGLSLGSLMGMQPEEFGQYKTRQQEYNQQIDELNRRATEMNPQLIQRERLANQQQQYMMPTYEAQGKKAQAEMGSNLYPTEVASKIAGFGAATAKSNVEEATNKAVLPYAGPAAGAEAKTKMQLNQLDQTITAVNGFNETDPAKVKAIIQQEVPTAAKWILPVIDNQGIEPARKLILSMLDEQRNYLIYRDPKHLQKMQEIMAQVQGQKDVAGITAGAKTAAEKEYSAFIDAYLTVHPKATRLEAHEAWISARYQPDKTIIGPNGKPIFIEQKTGATAPTTPAAAGQVPQVTIDGVKYDVIGKNQDGSIKIKDPKTGKTGTYRP